MKTREVETTARVHPEVFPEITGRVKDYLVSHCWGKFGTWDPFVFLSDIEQGINAQWWAGRGSAKLNLMNDLVTFCVIRDLMIDGFLVKKKVIYRGGVPCYPPGMFEVAVQPPKQEGAK